MHTLVKCSPPLQVHSYNMVDMLHIKTNWVGSHLTTFCLPGVQLFSVEKLVLVSWLHVLRARMVAPRPMYLNRCESKCILHQEGANFFDSHNMDQHHTYIGLDCACFLETPMWCCALECDHCLAMCMSYEATKRAHTNGMACKLELIHVNCNVQSCQSLYNPLYIDSTLTQIQVNSVDDAH